MTTATTPRTDLMLAALVDPRHRHLFDRALTKAQESGDVGAYNFLHTCPASHSDRLVLALAFASWRGYGPAIEIDQLWGLEPEAAQRILTALALASVGKDAPAALEQAAERCRELLAQPEEPEEPEGT